MHLKTLAATGIAGTLIASGALTSSAAAHYPPQAWYNYNTSLVDRDTVRMAPANDVGDASIYNFNIDYPVNAGDVVSFFMDTQGQTVCNYYPYVYMEVDGLAFTSHDDGTGCPGETTLTRDDGTVTFTIRETGTLGFAQIYYYDYYDDNLNGVVEISDLRVGDEPIYFEVDPGPDPAPQPVPIATEYGATLSKPRPCRVKTFAYHDAALEGQVASPRRRHFITRVDGRIRADFIVGAGRTGKARIGLRPDTGRRTVVVRLANGQLLDRIKIRTRRC